MSQGSTNLVGNLQDALDMHCMREESGKEVFLVADICGAGKFGRVRNRCSETQCKGSLHAENGEKTFLPIADGTVKLSGRDHGIRKSTSVGSEELSGDLQGSSDKSQPIDKITDCKEARDDFWSIAGN